jgi:hypothetical protein
MEDTESAAVVLFRSVKEVTNCVKRSESIGYTNSVEPLNAAMKAETQGKNQRGSDGNEISMPSGGASTRRASRHPVH